MIEVVDLRKRFGRREVLRGLSLALERGAVTAVLGPNGSGKTTLIKAALGLVRPDAGTVLFDRRPVDPDGRYRERIGYMPQAAPFPENLTAAELLDFLKNLRGRPAHTDEELLDAFGLETELEKPLRTLSGGTRQKVSAALAFLFGPDLLVLDEPTAGLDPVASSTLKDKVLRARAAGKTVLLTSHIMSEVEELADHVVYLLDGRVRFEGSALELKRQTGQLRLERAIAHLIQKPAA